MRAEETMKREKEMRGEGTRRVEITGTETKGEETRGGGK